ncbi:MAG TPA: packaged DNA stabilization protein, partial [Phnomibacter sp.]|nr:packaged DNA stabilization protein [Phnomibacter sp.]
VMSNWPATTTYPESVKTIQSTQHSESGDSIAITALNEVGHLTLTVTPTNANNVTGFPITINESEWATGVSQSPPGSGIPYITDLKVSGIKFAGSILYVSYTFMPNSGNATDISKLEWVQTIPETTVENMQYDFTPVGDVCRIRGRYVFNKKGTDSFFLTSLDDESKPDRVAAEYRAENMPDAIIAMREFRDFVLAFGSSTVEFYKLTGDANNLISFASSYMVSVGLCGQFALAEFADTFAFITSPARGQVQVVLMGQGSYTPISDRHVNKLLSTYTPAQLAAVVVEGLKSEDNEFLILHLPDHTVVFNATSKLWNIIKTGVTEGGFVGHRAIDYRNEGNIITCGDKIRGYLGYQDFTISSQYGEDQEIILYSPLITQERAIIFDLQLTANTGLASQASRLYISITTDGHNYGRETLIEYDAPYKWLSRTIMQKVGMVVIRMGFKIRVVGATPCTLSNLRARAM